MIDIRYRKGVELPSAGFWLDPRKSKPFAFVSHAHSDHMARHAKVVASQATGRLMRARIGSRPVEHLLEFGQTHAMPGFQITLLPAGHIFGSAQCFLETDAGSLLYTGDFKLRASHAAEPTQWRQADTLIMETTFGRPKYALPPTESVLAEMIAFCRQALADGAVPVLLGYSLGKAQEILCALIRAGLTPMLHPAVEEMTAIYREWFPGFPSGSVPWEAGGEAGKVLICPPHLAQSKIIQALPRRRTAVLTGWAIDAGARFRYGCDAAFPLSDHADYPDLMRYVDLVQPRQVLTLHGFAADFARDLRRRGIEAWALSAENQLELAIDTPLNLPRKPLLPASTSGSGIP